MQERVNEIFIGNKDPYHWFMYDGKDTLMEILYSTILDVVENDLEEKIAAKVSFTFDGKQKSMNFVVNREGLGDTVEKVFEWALDNERYEFCSELKYIKERLHNEDFSYRG